MPVEYPQPAARRLTFDVNAHTPHSPPTTLKLSEADISNIIEMLTAHYFNCCDEHDDDGGNECNKINDMLSTLNPE
jgi:hypothetical protein